MAEKCGKKAFELLSNLAMVDDNLKKGKGFIDEAAEHASLAGVHLDELKDENCITEEKWKEIDDEIAKVSYLTTLKKLEESRTAFKPIREKIPENLIESAIEWAPKYIKEAWK